MANVTQEFIDNLITVIYSAEDPESVTNEMVARVFDHLNNGYKNLLTNIQAVATESAERQAADAALQRNIDGVGSNVELLRGELHRSTSALNTWIAEVNDKTDGVLEKTRQNRETIDAILGSNASDAIDNFNEIISFLEGVKDDQTLAGLLLQLQQEDKHIAQYAELQSMIAADKAVIRAGDSVVMEFDSIISYTSSVIEQSGIPSGYEVVWIEASRRFAAVNPQTQQYYDSWPEKAAFMAGERPLKKLYRCRADGAMYCVGPDGGLEPVVSRPETVIEFEYVLRRELAEEQYKRSFAQAEAADHVVWSDSARCFLIERKNGGSLTYANNCADFGVLRPYYAYAGAPVRRDRLFRERATGIVYGVSGDNGITPVCGCPVRQCYVYDNEELDLTVERQSYAGPVTGLMQVVYWGIERMFVLKQPGLNPRYYSLWPGSSEYNAMQGSMINGRLFLNRTDGELIRCDGGMVEVLTPESVGSSVVSGNDNNIYVWDKKMSRWKPFNIAATGGGGAPDDGGALSPGDIDDIIGTGSSGDTVDDGEALTPDDIDNIIAGI